MSEGQRSEYFRLRLSDPQIRKKNNERSRRWKIKNRDKLLQERNQKRQTLAEYIDEVQQGLCAICHKPETRKNPVGQLRILSQDHDHVTGLLRAFLCSHCNLGLGNFYDDPSLLREAAEYIEEWKKSHLNDGDLN